MHDAYLMLHVSGAFYLHKNLHSKGKTFEQVNIQTREELDMKEMFSAFRGYFKVTLYVFCITISVWAIIEQTVSLALMAFLLSFLCGTPSFTSTIDDIRLANYQVVSRFQPDGGARVWAAGSC
ncbi:hypothetical protein, partial [Streptomyces prasinus]